jgi:hypothetical protein
MGLPEWQHELDVCLGNDLNVIHLDLQHLIKTQQAQECKCVSSLQQTTGPATSPCMDITFLVLTIVAHTLDIPVLRFVVEVIHSLQNVLLVESASAKQEMGHVLSEILG